MSASSKTPERTERVADAPAQNWVDRVAPEPIRPYLRLSRADRPIGTWLLLLPCWWSLALAVATEPDPSVSLALWVAIACAIGAFLMRGAGCTWNDVTDRDLDGSVRRTASRPIPSGQVSVKSALVWALLQALIAFGILLTFNSPAILLGVLSLVPVTLYPFAKRVTWWPQVVLGLAFNWGALLAWVAYKGSLSPAAVFLYLAGISWTLFYDTIYAHQDREDDALIGVKSTARLFGNSTKKWLLGFLIATFLLGLCSIISAFWSIGFGAAGFIAALGCITMALHLGWQLRRLDIDDTEGCLMLFRSNRDAGFILALFFAAAALV